MFFLEPDVKMPGWVIGKPGEEELIGFGDAVRRASEAFTFWVLAYGDQYLPDGTFDPRPVDPVFRASVRQFHGPEPRPLAFDTFARCQAVLIP